MLVFPSSFGRCAHPTDLLDLEETVQPLLIPLLNYASTFFFALYQVK